MHDYDEMLASAIRYRFAPAIADVMASMPVQEIAYPAKSINLPMRAEASLLYEKELAAFGVRGRVKIREEIFAVHRLFSTREISTNRDAAHIVARFFDALKEEFLSALANNELERYGVGKI